MDGIIGEKYYFGENYFFGETSDVNKEGKASSENMTVERDAPSSEEVEDSVSILRKKAEGRIFPGTSWFDGKNFETNITKYSFRYVEMYF